MNVIWKWTVDFTKSQVIINLPDCSDFLDFQNIDGVLTFWETHPVACNEILKPKTLLLIPTGMSYNIYAHYKYLKTVSFYNGSFIIHIFDITKG